MFKILDKFGLTGYYTDEDTAAYETYNVIKIPVQFGLKILAKVGYGILRENTRLERLCRWTNITCMTIMTLGCLMALFDPSLTLLDLILLIQTMGSMCQAVGRYIVIIYYKPQVIQLVEQLNKFWKIENLADDEKSKYLNFYRIQSKIYQMFLIIACTSCVSYIMKPFFGSLPFYIWTPSDGIITLYTASFVGFAFLYTVGLMIIAFDIAFISICNNVTIQFKLLQARIEEIEYCDDNVQKNDKTINKLIRYHTFLLDYIQILEKTLTSFLLNQYFLTALSGCAYTVAISLIDDINIVDTLEAVLYVFTIALQFSMYCVALTEITLEARNVGNSIFHSRWYNSNGTTYKTKLLLMIMRSQKNRPFTAGGLADITRESIISVCRLCMSVMTFMKTIHET